MSKGDNVSSPSSVIVGVFDSGMSGVPKTGLSSGTLLWSEIVMINEDRLVTMDCIFLNNFNEAKSIKAVESPCSLAIGDKNKSNAECNKLSIAFFWL